MRKQLREELAFIEREGLTVVASVKRASSHITLTVKGSHPTKRAKMTVIDARRPKAARSLRNFQAQVRRVARELTPG